MWKKTILLNTLFMCVLGVGSSAGSYVLYNNFVQYPSTDSVELPIYCQMALRVRFLTWLIPCFWICGYFFTIFKLKNKIENQQDFVQLHTSATLLVGFTMLVFFIVTGQLPNAKILLGF